MRKILSAFAIVALAASQAAAQNLVENPSFELPTVDSGSANDVWFRFGSGANGSATESTVAPRTGARHIQLSLIGSGQFTGVFQNLNTPISPGQEVTFSGYVRNALGVPFSANQEIKLEWQGSPNPPLNQMVSPPTLSSTYGLFTHTGVAPAGTTGLVVTYAIAGQGDATVYLDDVSVTVVPEPGCLALAGCSLGALALRRRRPLG